MIGPFDYWREEYTAITPEEPYDYWRKDDTTTETD